jgi:hypothetical protein
MNSLLPVLKVQQECNETNRCTLHDILQSFETKIAAINNQPCAQHDAGFLEGIELRVVISLIC